MSIKKSLITAGAALSALPVAALAQNQVNMSAGVTKVGAEIYDLHMLIMIICIVIGIGVFGVMLYSIIYHRKSKGFEPSQFHESTKVEIAWTVVPFLILIGMAVPATSTLLEVYDNDDAELDILVTGHQWKWRYEYLNADGENVSFFSNLATPQEEIYNSEAKGEHYLLEVDEPLVVPVGTKVRFLITAADVIHYWWVPALAVKKDAIPGFINESWTRIEEPGIYRGQCTELCGKDHGFMPVVVEAKSKEDFDAWLAERKAAAAAERELTSKEWTMEELMARGEKAYVTACAACHQPTGEGLPPMFPALKGSAIAKGPAEGHIDIVYNGKPGTSMAAFGKQLSPVDLAAIITYERNAWGNNVGDMVTPKDILDFSKAQE